MTAAKLLEIHFDGYFMCRLATDPDPTNEPRGMSGYTMALASEAPLDQVIRLQWDSATCRDHEAREPMCTLGNEPEVLVRSVTFDGRRCKKAQTLLENATVSLAGRGDVFPGPTFQSRNNIVGSDDTLAFAIDPFDLRIRLAPEVHRGRSSETSIDEIRAVDFLHPADAVRFKERGCSVVTELGPGPEETDRSNECFQPQAIWEIDDPAIYQRRLPFAFDTNSQEAKEAIGVFDLYRYFRDRRRHLERYIEDLETKIKSSDEEVGPLTFADERLERCDPHVEIEAAKSRLYQLEAWGWRVINKLAFKVDWSHQINGVKHLSEHLEKDLGFRIDRDGPWTVKYWFGGWDGDLLVGFMRGSLSMPATPEDSSGQSAE